MSGKRYPPEMREKARTMHAEGASQYKIAAHLGVSRDTVRAWVLPHRAKRSGIKRARERADA